MNRSLSFRRRNSMAFTLLLLIGVSSLSHAQARVVQSSLLGIQYRILGDTIWRDRDTTSVQSVYRGDTLYENRFVFGRKIQSEIFVINGDNAKIVSSLDGAGKTIPSTRSNGTSAGGLEGTRMLLENAFRTVDSDARMREAEARLQESYQRALALGLDVRPPPKRAVPDSSPTVKRVYPIAASRLLEQLGDTVRYISRCAARPPVDTTVYLLFASDSVRRLSPSPRTFDAMMARAVRSDMRSVATRQAVSVSDSSLAKNIPGFSKWPCDLR
ncbi:MAG: hypothetical protein ABJB74_19740 [Gemmatimonas sp.]